MTPKPKSTPSEAGALAALKHPADYREFQRMIRTINSVDLTESERVELLIAEKSLENLFDNLRFESSSSMKADVELLVEKLAALEHEQWVTWAKNIIDNEPRLTNERVFRWGQLFIPYSQLTEQQKEQDRVWARKVLAAINSKESRE